MHNLLINAFSTAAVVDFLISFQTDGQGQIAYTLHLLAELIIYKCSVCKCMEYTVVVFLAQADNIFLSHERLSACQHIKINSKFFSLCDHTIHIFKRKIQKMSVLCCPASGTFQITCAGWVHQDQPWNVTLIFFT